MNEAEFKRLPIEERIKIVNKRCDELGGKHLSENFQCPEIDIPYQHVAKIMNQSNYTLFRGRYYRVVLDEEKESKSQKAPEIKKVSCDNEEDNLFELLKQAQGMKNAKSNYFKMSQELIDKWNNFKKEKFDYVSSGNLIVMAILDFMNRH